MTKTCNNCVYCMYYNRKYVCDISDMEVDKNDSCDRGYWEVEDD